MRGSCSWWQCLSVVSGVRGRVWRVDCSDSVIWTVGAGSSPVSHTPHSCTPISLNLLITNDTNNSFKNYFCGLIHHWWLELFKRWWTKVIEYFIVLSITKNNNDVQNYLIEKWLLMARLMRPEWFPLEWQNSESRWQIMQSCDGLVTKIIDCIITFPACAEWCENVNCLSREILL